MPDLEAMIHSTRLQVFLQMYKNTTFLLVKVAQVFPIKSNLFIVSLCGTVCCNSSGYKK